MSQGQPVPYNIAFNLAASLLLNLEPGCDRIEVAGSVRRRRRAVSDIELVAIPKIETVPGPDLWKTPVEVDQLEDLIATALSSGNLQARQVENHRADGSVDVGSKLGDRYKALEYQGFPVDLFIVRPPADWGVVFALRTGPGDWNTRIVTDCQRYFRRVDQGRVYAAGQYVPCPDERDFFAAVGQPWVEPEERSVARVRIQPRVQVAAG